MVNAIYNVTKSSIGHKRHERSTQSGKVETTPDEVTEAHVSLILAVMEQEYKENGIEGLNESSWTTLLVNHANTYGMKVSREMLIKNVEKREQSKKQGNFFTDLSEAITTMRTGIMLDKNIRVLDGYAA
jgi:hypothetical protein